MCKRAILMLLALIMVPSFTSAATYWQITATTSPTALKTNLTAARPANFGNYTTPGGAAMTLTKVTNIALNTAASTVSFNVAAVPGKSVIVKVDGVQVGTVPGTYTVIKGTNLSHNIVAYYSSVAQYTLTTQASGGGTISPSASYQSNGTVSVTPFTGYVLTGLQIGATTYALADTLPAGISLSGNASGATYTFASGSYTLQGVFAAAPKASAVISTPNMTVDTGATGIEIDGSTSSSNVAGTTYAWTATCGMVTATAPNAKTATYTAPATVGTCMITLTTTAAGVSPNPTANVNITTQSPILVAIKICLDCHNGTDGPASMGYETSAHMGQTSCQRCHNPDNTASHAYEPYAVVANACPTCHSTPPAAHSAAGNCNICHNPHSLAVRDVTSTTSVCVTCHTTATPAIEVAWQSGAHGAASGHTTGTCQRCHASKGAIVGANVGWTGSYTDVLSAFQAAIWTPNQPVSTNGITCAVCHDPHSGTGLLPINTYDGSAAVAWDPNQNGQNNDQFDVCTSCHTIYNNTGAVTDMYHEKSSINVTRMLADSHYDNPATGVGLATNVVEGYVIRAKGANPCGDCHNVHRADLIVQEAWAKSAHAGKIATKKDEAACAQSVIWFNGLFPANTATACTDTKTAIVPPSTTSSTRTVLTFFQRNAAGVAFYKTVGALDDAAGNAWTHYNWDQTTGTGNRGACTRCHTATGIANFLDSPATYNALGAGNDFSHLSGWTSATGSPQNELLYCWGCHSDAQTGALRNPGAITEIYAAATAGSPTATVAYPDMNQSNVCMGCHLGREIGKNVANDIDADGVRSFINSHYLTAGATIFNKSGYEFAGQTYNTTGYHKNVGMADAYNTGTAGPCVTCHMTSAEGHAFELATKDANGAITAVTSTQCANCHGNLTAAAMEASKHEFHLAMEELKAALFAKGIEFKPAHPYFYIAGTSTGFTNWAGVYGLASWKDVMGAAFNYNLLEHDPGAYAHNRQYALKLIQDSIDFMADGVVNGAGISAAFTAAATNKEFTETTTHPAPIVAVPSPTDCGTCHQQAPHFGGAAAYTSGGVTWNSSTLKWEGTATTVLGKAQYTFVGVTCAECHTAGNTTANGPILVQYAESGHGNVMGDGWIHYNWKWTAATADVVGSSDRKGCARCHTSTGFKAALASNPPPFAANNGDAANPAEVLSCGACHSDLADGSLRNPGAVSVKATSYPTVTVKVPNADTPPVLVGVVLPDAGKSNGCNYCHSGAGNMFSTWAATRIASHHAVAAGTLYGTTTRIGFEFQTADTTPAYLDYSIPAYITSPKHADIGLEVGGTGACVGCHMPSKDHRFEVVDVATTSIRSQALCNTCHTVGSAYEMTYVKLEEEKVGYVAAGALLAAFINNAPQNYKGAVVAGSVTSNNDRAAWYNSKLFPTEEKGAFAHNRFYVKRLMFDSIDWLQDGVLNGTLTTGTAATEINPTTYATALAWLGTARP